VIPWLRPEHPPEAFPPVEEALQEPNGLLCVGGDLSVERLLEAYRRGIFPWFSAGQPILWWSPDPRTVLYPGEFKVARSLAKTLRNRGFRTTVDQAFEQVMERCADPALRPEGTWISPQMHAAYRRLHELDYAHSFETWEGDQLVGGLYGVALGRVFFGESMFSVARDASKVALHALVQASLAQNVRLIDCQVESEHLRSLGARSVPRREFMRELAAATRESPPGASWRKA
jgi:leucyl/phenylalanyl-tRNA---protein transferase